MFYTTSEEFDLLGDLIVLFQIIQNISSSMFNRIEHASLIISIKKDLL